MREIMAASVVPSAQPSLWTVIHTGDEPLQGPHRYAFTSRDTLTRWAAAREDGWRWVLLSETPNSIILVLDEAWGWKYTDPVPEMDSTEDGRRVLKRLLRGRAVGAQGRFREREHFLLNSLRGTSGGADILCGAYLLREWYAEYVALDPMNWEANGEVTADGELAAHIPRGAYYVASPGKVIAMGRGDDLVWYEKYAGPVMVMEGCITYNTWQWAPEPGKTEPPLYVGLLAS